LVEGGRGMKILLLIILMSRPFRGINNRVVVEQTVASQEEAAVLFWKEHKSVSFPEPKHYEGHLYEIDFASMTVKEIDIPEISFNKK